MVGREKSKSAVMIHRAREEDLPRLEAVRAAAFVPISAGHREIHEPTQAPEDRRQGELLASLLTEGAGWEVYLAEVAGQAVGFLSVRLDAAMGVGEFGLNAVHPDHAGRGIGTRMHEVALGRMREAKMRVVTVATGGIRGMRRRSEGMTRWGLGWGF